MTVKQSQSIVKNFWLTFLDSSWLHLCQLKVTKKSLDFLLTFPDFHLWFPLTLIRFFSQVECQIQSMKVKEKSFIDCPDILHWLCMTSQSNLQSKKMDLCRWKVNKKSSDFSLTFFLQSLTPVLNPLTHQLAWGWESHARRSFTSSTSPWNGMQHPRSLSEWHPSSPSVPCLGRLLRSVLHDEASPSDIPLTPVSSQPPPGSHTQSIAPPLCGTLPWHWLTYIWLLSVLYLTFTWHINDCFVTCV